MPSPETPYDQLPANLQSGLEQFCADLSSSLGDELLSVAIYGAVARGESIEFGKTPVPVLVVLQDATVRSLSKISDVTQKAIASIQAAPFVVSLHDLQTSTDIFPIKFLDMQTHHVLLAGRDVLSELEISTEHLRLRCEQELCNLLLRLRNVFLRNAGNDDALKKAVEFGVAPFFTALGAAVSLKTGLTPVSERETADSAANVLSLDRDVLGRLLEFHASSSGASKDLADLFNTFIGVVETAANFVDQLDDDAP
jgi:hypothetical protein